MDDKHNLVLLKEKLDEAEGTSDALNRLRALSKLEHEVSYLVKRAMAERSRLDGVVRQIKDEQVFLNRHRLKIRKLTTLMERVYTHPQRAFRTLEVLFRHYHKEELMTRLREYPSELGGMFGFDFWLFQTPLRRRALQNYSKWVLPSIREIADEHLAFLKSEQIDWDERLTRADNNARAGAAHFADTELMRIRVEMGKLTAAKGVTDDDKPRLSKIEIRNIQVLLAKAEQSNEKLLVAQSRAQALKDAHTDDAAASANETATDAPTAEESLPADPLAGVIPDQPKPGPGMAAA